MNVEITSGLALSEMSMMSTTLDRSVALHYAASRGSAGVLLETGKQLLASFPSLFHGVGVGAQSTQAFLGVAHHVAIPAGRLGQLLETFLGGDPLGGGVTYGGDAVVAGLANQGGLVIEPGQGGESQLLVIALEGDLLEHRRVVQGLDDLLAAAKSEAASSFGDDSVYIEKRIIGML